MLNIKWLLTKMSFAIDRRPDHAYNDLFHCQPFDLDPVFKVMTDLVGSMDFVGKGVFKVASMVFMWDGKRHNLICRAGCDQ